MKDSTYRLIVVALLTVNTFFLGSIWCSMTCSKFGGPKMCPITGKPLSK